MSDLIAIIRDLGFPAGVAIFTLWRLEKRLMGIESAVVALLERGRKSDNEAGQHSDTSGSRPIVPNREEEGRERVGIFRAR